jgi:hypothetical protein
MGNLEAKQVAALLNSFSLVAFTFIIHDHSQNFDRKQQKKWGSSS